MHYNGGMNKHTTELHKSLDKYFKKVMPKATAKQRANLRSQVMQVIETAIGSSDAHWARVRIEKKHAKIRKERDKAKSDALAAKIALVKYGDKADEVLAEFLSLVRDHPVDGKEFNSTRVRQAITTHKYISQEKFERFCEKHRVIRVKRGRSKLYIVEGHNYGE